MKTPESLEAVAAFHRLFGHPVIENPAIPDEKRCNLRVALLSEELKELEVAIAEQDLTGIADALCDLQYVLSGAILEFGLGNKFEALFNEVQRSNMSKACKSLEEAEATLLHYQKQGVDAYYVEKDGLFLVYRRADNKTLKSVAYSEAQLDALIR